MNNLFTFGENAQYLQALVDKKNDLVPFLGAGFSKPTCAGWEDFLKNYFTEMKNKGKLLSEEISTFEGFINSEMPNRLETMAEFLVKKYEGPGFKAEMKRQMDVTVPPNKIKRYHLLHEAFPYLKITTNFDRLIEATVPQGVYVDVAYGYELDKLERLFTLRHEQQCLLKIHGGIGDMHSIVLSAEQYEELYGDKQRYDIQALLPSFLHRVFTNATVLFIGCSLEHDRTTMILEDLNRKREMPTHFALMKLPETGREKILVQRRLDMLGICVIWLESYEQIEEVLAFLAGKVLTPALEVSLTKMGSFVGREKELATISANLEDAAIGGGGESVERGSVQTITGRLYSINGIGGVGKTALALEAARRFGDKFKDGVLPLFRVDELTPVSFAVKLAACLGVQLPEPADVEAARQAVTFLLQNRRCLILLDNVEKWEDLRYMIPPQTSAAVLVTTRNRDIYHKIRNYCQGLVVEEIALEKFTEKEALALFQEMMGTEYRETEEKIYLEIARDLGFLPIALRQAIALMVYMPHYRAAELRDKLKGDSRLELLRQGYAEVESDTRVIEAVFDLSAPVLTGDLREVLAILAVCSPGPAALDFLERIIECLRRPGTFSRKGAWTSQSFSLTEVLGGPGTVFQKGPWPPEAKGCDLAERLERLYTYSWCERRDVEGRRYYELHQLVRELVRKQGKREIGGDLPYEGEFLDVVHEMFTDKNVHFSEKERNIFQLEEGFTVAVERKDPRLKEDWLYDLYDFCTYRGYGHFYLRLTEAVERLFPGDSWALRAVYGNRALLLQGWGKLEEALACHKKEEKIKEELGDRAGLARSYGNQALILSDWGRLEEAMNMLQKEEAICEELGDRAGLSRSYGNQALILKAWGRLEEAMNLHQKEEAICEELGDRAGLSRSYGNQALILSDWGRLEEAMNLFKKVETIFEELGDRAGLSCSYGNQALILSDWGRLEEAMNLFKKVETIFEELGDRAGLSRSYGNQALILSAWGRLEEAMNLHQKEEAICEELGERAGLATCYGNQALILKAWGRLEEAMNLHQKEEAICEELGDRAGLSRSYGNQALILRRWGRLEEAMNLHQKEEKIKEELGDRAGLSKSYCGQALILKAWGRLEEAMNLHQKEEAICEELGDRAGLARTWWNQGLIYKKQGDPRAQAQLWRKAIDTNKSMGIPTSDDELKLKALLEKMKEAE